MKMEKQTHIFTDTESFDLMQLSADQCLITTPSCRFILSHEAALDLATRLAYLIAKMDADSELSLIEDGLH